MRIEKDQIITLGVITLVLVAGLVVGWIPANNAIKQHKQELSTLKSKLAKHQMQTADLAKVSMKVKQLKSELDSAPKQLSKEVELASLLRQLSSNLQTQQVADQTIITRSMERGEDFNLMPLRLTFKTDYVSVFAFLQTVEKMPRLMHLSRLEIENTKDRTAEGLPMCKVSIDLNAFFTPGEGGSL